MTIANRCQPLPRLANFDRRVARFDQYWPRVAKRWSHLAKCDPKFDPKATNVGRYWGQLSKRMPKTEIVTDRPEAWPDGISPENERASLGFGWHSAFPAPVFTMDPPWEKSTRLRQTGSGPPKTSREPRPPALSHPRRTERRRELPKASTRACRRRLCETDSRHNAGPSEPQRRTVARLRALNAPCSRSYAAERAADRPWTTDVL